MTHSKILVLFFLSCCVLAGCNSKNHNFNFNDLQSHNTGGNPVIHQGSADPSVKVFNDKVYIYSSHDFSRDNDFWIMKDWKVFSTKDLVNYKDHGIILKGTDLQWASEPNHCWAPDCAEKNGKYYFYFPLSDVRGIWKGEIGVGVADSPEGPFTDALGHPLIGKDDMSESFDASIYNIDPVVFTDDDDRSYLFWGNGACLMVELNVDMISFKSKIIHIQIENHQGYTEGPFVWKRDGLYYLLYSQGGGRSFDVLDYATSRNIDGPYQYRGTIMGHGMKGNIHGSVFDFKGQWYVAYHDLFPTDKYRMTCLERIHYLSNGDIAEVKSTKEGVGWYNGNEKIEAEDYFEKSNDITYTNHDTTDFHMRHIKDGNWLRFPNVKLPFDFTNQFSTRVATADEGGIIEIILDSLDGRKAGEIKAKNTGGWNNWQVFNTAVDSISGTHDIYLKFSGAHTMRLNLDWFRLY